MDEFEEFRCRAFSAGRAPIGYSANEQAELGIDTFRARLTEKRRHCDSGNGLDKVNKALDELTLHQYGDHSQRSISPTPKSPLAEGFNQQLTPSKLHRNRPSSLR